MARALFRVRAWFLVRWQLERLDREYRFGLTSEAYRRSDGDPPVWRSR